MLVEGTTIFKTFLTQHDSYQGQSTGKYSIQVKLDGATASKLTKDGVHIKEYDGEPIRKFTSRFDVPVHLNEKEMWNIRTIPLIRPLIVSLRLSEGNGMPFKMLEQHVLFGKIGTTHANGGKIGTTHIVWNEKWNDKRNDERSEKMNAQRNAKRNEKRNEKKNGKRN